MIVIVIKPVAGAASRWSTAPEGPAAGEGGCGTVTCRCIALQNAQK